MADNLGEISENVAIIVSQTVVRRVPKADGEEIIVVLTLHRQLLPAEKPKTKAEKLSAIADRLDR